MVIDNTKYIYWLKNTANFILFPTQNRLTNLLKVNKYKIDSFLSFFNLYKNNIILKNKLEDYNNLAYKIDILKRENISLKNLLNLNVNLKERLINSKVIGRTLDEWYSAIIIDKGLNDGIKKGAVAVSYHNKKSVLIGQVVEVSNNYSKVLMITNIDSNIVVFIPKKNAYGILSGDNSKLLLMKSFKNCGNLEKDDIVITSGFGGVFPYGIYVGKIKVLEYSKNVIVGAKIEPSQNIDTISFLSIIADPI
jgi:rod shape-determining protein MreC